MMDDLSRMAGAPSLADYTEGQRVMTPEGFPGVIDEVLEGPRSLTTYMVTLDNGMGGGEYSESEIQLLQQSNASRIDASIEHTAADDYPELGSILTDRLPPQITTHSSKQANRLEEVAQAAQRLADGLPRCTGCGEAYVEVEGEMHDHWTAAYEGTSVSGHCETCGKALVLKRGVLTHADGSNDHPAQPSGDSNAPIGVASSLTDAEAIAQHLSLYLPPLPKAEQRASTSDITPEQKAGYDEGFSHGREGITRNPSDPMDEDFVAGYAIGWAEGVLVAREPANSWDIDDLNADQRADIPSAAPALINPPLSSLAASPDIIATEAGLWDLIKGDPQPNKGWGGVGAEYSYDWCRFRKMSHCHLPKELNEAASKQAGYAVWVPFDRGTCPRVKWEQQQVCPTGEPGPHVPGGYTDATVPWEQGGQHGGVPTAASAKPKPLVCGPCNRTGGGKIVCRGCDRTVCKHFCSNITTPDGQQYDPLRDDRPSHLLGTCVGCRARGTASLQTHAVFEVTATWRDVREKAKRIRSEEGVRLVAMHDNVVVAHVRGDHGIYETELVRHPGRANAAAWHCGCKWSSYSWGRSGPWKRYEGRMCSHALAVQYEAQSRGAMGRTLTLDEKQPAWMDGKHVHRPGDYDKDKQRYSSKIADTLRPTVEFADDEPAPATMLAHAMLAEGSKYAEVRAMLLAQGVEKPVEIIKQARSATFWGKVRGIVERLLLKDDGVEDGNGRRVPPREVLYPGWHPTKGLNLNDRKTGAVLGEQPFRLTGALFDGYDDEEMEQYAEEFKHDPVHIMERHYENGIMALVHGIPVGQITYTIEQDTRALGDDDDEIMAARGDHNGYYPKIDSIAVDRAFRRRGVGTMLLKAFIDWADRSYGDFDPGGFTRDGAALWKAVRGETVPVTQGITYSTLEPHTAGQYDAVEQRVTLDGQEFVLRFDPLRSPWWRAIQATVNGGEAGYLTWGFDNKIGDIGVKKRWQRRGLATAMWHFAKTIVPDLQHSHALLPDGKAWMESLGSKSKDESVPPSEHGDPRLQDAGVSVKRTPSGKYYVHTHRARGEDRDSVADIPDSEIEAIEATGSLTKQADEDQCPVCSGDSLAGGRGYVCQDCGHDWSPNDPHAKAFHGDGPLSGIPFGEFWEIPGLMTRRFVEPSGGFNGSEVSYDFQQYPPFLPAHPTFFTEDDLRGMWLDSPEAQAGLTAEQALAQVYHEQEPDLFPSVTAAVVDDAIALLDEGFANGEVPESSVSWYAPTPAGQQVAYEDGLMPFEGKKKDDGPSVSGVALKALDTGRILMLQRGLEDQKDPARGAWEFPGGHHEDGDTTSLHAGIREWEEEVGIKFPEGGLVAGTWQSPDGVYQGHVVTIPEEKSVILTEGRDVDNPDDPDGDASEQVAWWDPDHAKKNPALREECKATPWDMLKKATSSPKEGSKMDIADEFGSLFDEAAAAGPPRTAAQQARALTEWGLDPIFADLHEEPEPALPTTDGADDEDSPDKVAQRLAAAFGGGPLITVNPGPIQPYVPPTPAPVVAGFQRDAGLPVCPKCQHTIAAGDTLELVGGVGLQHKGPCPSQQSRQSAVQDPAARRPGESEEERGRRLLAYVDASLKGQQVEGPNPYAHLVAGQADNEIAAGAANFLVTKGGIQTEALKTYSPVERQQIIAEGENSEQAGNLDRLDITGTHYEALEATSSRDVSRQINGGRDVPEDEDMTFLDGDPNLPDM